MKFVAKQAADNVLLLLFGTTTPTASSTPILGNKEIALSLNTTNTKYTVKSTIRKHLLATLRVGCPDRV